MPCAIAFIFDHLNEFIEIAGTLYSGVQIHFRFSFVEQFSDALLQVPGIIGSSLIDSSQSLFIVISDLWRHSCKLRTSMNSKFFQKWLSLQQLSVRQRHFKLYRPGFNFIQKYLLERDFETGKVWWAQSYLAGLASFESFLRAWAGHFLIQSSFLLLVSILHRGL